MSYHRDPTEDEELDTIRAEASVVEWRVEEPRAVALRAW